MTKFDINKLLNDTIPKVAVTVAIVYLAYDSFHTEGVPEGVLLAMISLLSMATGYWLGSSAGSNKKTDMISEDEKPPAGFNE